MDAGCCRLFSRAVTRLPGAERGGRAYRAATEREAVEVTAADAAELLDSAGLENNQVMDPRALYQRGEVVAHAAADEALLGAYKVTGYLGGGGFGSVYAATVTRGPALQPGTRVALKFDRVVGKDEDEARAEDLPGEWLRHEYGCRPDLASMRSSVLREAHAYALLLDGGVAADAPVPAFCVAFVAEQAVCRVLAQPTPECRLGYEPRDVFALALPRLGRSVYALAKRKDGVTLQQALHLGAGMIAAVQYVHHRGLLHLDIKPENFCVERDDVPLEDAKLCVVDFGLALEVQHELKKAHAAPAASATSARDGAAASRERSGGSCSDSDSDGPWFYGTPQYASRRALALEPLSYRDDLESVFFVVAELALGRDGKLPWAGRYVETEGADGRSSLSAGICTGEFMTHSFDGVKAARRTADYAAFVARLPAQLRELWALLEQLEFGVVPDYIALRAALLPQRPVLSRGRAPLQLTRVSGGKRCREEEAPSSATAAAAAAATESVQPLAGPHEPNGKRLRAMLVTQMLREE